MSTVSFKLTEIKKMAEHARNANKHRACFQQRFDRSLWKDEFKDVDISDDEVFIQFDGSHLDDARIPAGFFLAKDKDDGIYLMSNGLPLDFHPDGKRMNMVYAKGSLKGSDFVSFIPLEWYDLSVEKGKRTLSIRFNKESMSLVL